MSAQGSVWAAEVKARDPIMRLLFLAAGDVADDVGCFYLSFEAYKGYFCGKTDEAHRAALDAVSDGLFQDVVRLTATCVEARIPIKIRPNSPAPRSRVDRAAVFERDGRVCAACGATEDLQIDHYFPVSRGGTDDLWNLQVLCRPCNASKGSKMPSEWEGRING